MYQKYPSGEITLWCHGYSDTETSRGKRKEDDVDSVFKELKEKHRDKFSTVQLRLWARMVANDLHDDLEQPPSIPAFCTTPKRARQPSVSRVVSDAAVALTRALGESPKDKATISCQAGVSPAKSVELRMKNYEQLRYLQQLLDDRILSEEEYTEQKQVILGSLRKL